MCNLFGNFVQRCYIASAESTVRVLEYGTAVAKFDFVATAKNQLSFKKGDSLVLIRSIDDNWYEGRINNNQKGYIPINFIDVERAPITTRDPAPIPLQTRSNDPTHTKRRLSELDGDDEVFSNGSNLHQELSNELNAAVSELSTLALRVSEEFDDTMKENLV